MKFIGTYSCGYCGHDDVLAIIADSQLQAETFMQEGLCEYVMSNEDIVRDDEEFDDDEWHESQDYEDFFLGCYWELREATEKDIEDLCVGEEDWEDIRKEVF